MLGEAKKCHEIAEEPMTHVNQIGNVLDVTEIVEIERIGVSR